MIEVLIVNQTEVPRLLPMKECVDVMARAFAHASRTEPAVINVPRLPVVCPKPRSRVVSTTTRTVSGAMSSSVHATCSATVCTP